MPGRAPHSRYVQEVIATPPSVVLVDDAPEVRMLLRSALRVSGRYRVIGEGCNGEEAIELARRTRPDVLVLDISMPQMDGLEALPLVLEASPTTRVVLYTGFDPGGLSERARSLGATAIVQKSTAIEKFADELDSILGGLPAGADDHAVRSDAEPAPDAEPRLEPEPEPGPEPTADEDLGVEVVDEHLERFREVFEEAAIGMATMTLTGRLVRANRALARMVGHRLDELVGMAYRDLVDEASAVDLAAALTAHERGNDVTGFEHDLVVGGSARRLAATVAVARDSKEKALYLFLQLQDITSQRITEEALRSSEERFALLVDAVQDYAIFMLDPQGYIVSWNSGAQRAKGYLADEIVGQHFRVFYPPDKQAIRHPEHELEIAASEGHYEEEGWRLRKDGSMFWANVVISAVRSPSGRLLGYAKVTRDVTERRIMLQRQEQGRVALAEANQRLEEANKRLAEVAAKQAQFVAVTSHELRNPISVLTGASSMLVNNWDDLTDDERSGMLDSITTSSSRLSRLLSDLLTSSRLESGAMELHIQPVELLPLLEHVSVTTSRMFGGAELDVQCPPALVVDADPDRLAQAIENLTVNALRHGSGPVELSASSSDDRVEIRVSDAGPGVQDVVLPRLFERFATGRSPGGTGLGLFIVRELARAHGGDVRYEPGDRPAFTITLPVGAVVR
jgi:PAS domain S-box-containing protein